MSYLKVIIEGEAPRGPLPGLIYQEALEAGRWLLIFEGKAPSALKGFSAEIVEAEETEGALLRTPSGLEFSPFGEPSARKIVLSVEGAFGSGLHPTTRLCLELLDGLTPEEGPALDLGCGTGILSLLLARKGWPRVVALDVSPEAIKVLAKNIAQNRLKGRIFPVLGGLSALKGPFSLVAANLYLRLLIPEAQIIKGLLAPGGRLVLSGFLEESLPAVKRAYEGLVLEEERTLQGWAALKFLTP